MFIVIKLFSQSEIEKPVIPNCSTLKRFFEHLHFSEWLLLLWTVGETIEFKLRFKIRGSSDAAYKVALSPSILIRFCLKYEVQDSNEVCLPFCLNLEILAKDTRYTKPYGKKPPLKIIPDFSGKKCQICCMNELSMFKRCGVESSLTFVEIIINNNNLWTYCAQLNMRMISCALQLYYFTKTNKR